MFFQTLFHLCRLHLLQFTRLLREIGVARLVILLLVTVIFINQFSPFINFQSPWIGLVVLPLIFAFSGIKGEYSFFRILDLPVFALRFSRNLVFASPGIILLLVKQSFHGILTALTIILAFSFLPFAGFGYNQFPEISVKTRLLPWTVGLRRSLFWIGLYFALGVAGIFHVAFLFSAIFIIHFHVSGFFNHNEPPQILESYSLNSRDLLNYYTSLHLRYYAIPLFIILCLAAIFHTSYLIVFFVISTLLILHQWLTVYLKFAFYEPGKSNEGMQSIQTLMLAFLFIPFTIPIPFWYIFKYRKKAIENLESYL